MVALPATQRVVQVVGREEEVVRVVEARLPALVGPGQVLVRVSAAGVNPLDAMMARGYGRAVVGGAVAAAARARGLPVPPTPPSVVGRDLCGEVVAVGAGVRGLEVGEEVWGAAPPWARGTHQQYAAVAAEHLAPRPGALGALEAAAVPYAGLTALAALSTFGGLVEGVGARALVVGAGGGVGDLATQLLAGHFGAEVTAVAAADAAERAERCGAHRVLDYRHPQHLQHLLQLPRQDVVLDCAGLGATPAALQRLLPLLAPGGRLVTLSSPVLRHTDALGLLPGLAASLADLACANAAVLRRGATVRWAYYTPSPAHLATLGRLVRRGRLVPPPLTTFPLARAAEAYARVEAGGLRGKVVLAMEEEEQGTGGGQ